MKPLLRALVALAVFAFASQPVLAVDEVACGRVLGYSAATATATGSLVVARPGDVAPNGYYVVIPAGIQVSATGSSWICMRTTEIQPTQVAGGFTTTRAFAALIAPGASDYVPEPTSEVACGRLIGFEPPTVTARGGLTIDQSQPPPPPRPAPSPGAAVVPPGISFSVTPGTQLTYADLQGYFCVRFTSAISPRTFLGLVAPGSPGYLPEPISASSPPGASSAAGGGGGTGTLPNTSTDAPGPAKPMIALVSALLMLGTAAALSRRRRLGLADPD